MRQPTISAVSAMRYALIRSSSSTFGASSLEFPEIFGPTIDSVHGIGATYAVALPVRRHSCVWLAFSLAAPGAEGRLRWGGCRRGGAERGPRFSRPSAARQQSPQANRPAVLQEGARRQGKQQREKKWSRTHRRFVPACSSYPPTQTRRSYGAQTDPLTAASITI